jgi:hypothetical protein
MPEENDNGQLILTPQLVQEATLLVTGSAIGSTKNEESTPQQNLTLFKKSCLHLIALEESLIPSIYHIFVCYKPGENDNDQLISIPQSILKKQHYL